jgi:para-aminobenzoate synthetase/4-amino-4-deoxychorismate lyase
MTLRVIAGCADAPVFEGPVRTWAPHSFDGALAALHEAQRALDDGYWIAGGITYEFGAGLHGVDVRGHEEPLLVLGAFHEPAPDTAGADGFFAMSAPLSRISREAYDAAIAGLLQSIYDGEVYQVNYTVPFDVGFCGEPLALYRRLCERASVPYAVFMEYGGTAVVSISPELFLRFEGDRITAKPMKGTTALDRIAELHGEKNRAEHLMIVDLLRNDLHRFCREVSVDRLFQIERYPTFATMTSQIHGRTRARAQFAEAILATFPCGSVTGAPKRAAIEHIARFEQHARGFYTGTMGYMSPDGRGWWNVPIRTLQLRVRDTGACRARYDCGGGIVSDSNAQDEWNEILLKSRFLQPACEDFGILETLRCGPGGSDVEAHLLRLRKTARAFNIPLDVNTVRERIAHTANGVPSMLRIRACRDCVSVTSEDAGEHDAVDVCYSAERVDSSDPMLRFKTAWRPVHERARREAAERDCFDALLCNERGEITEGARTNVFARLDGTLYTPPLSCGVLPGILRTRLVSEGQAVERVLTRTDLDRAQAVFVGNSARGLLPARIR